MLSCAVRVLEEIARPFELHGKSGIVFQKGRLGIAFHHLQGVRVEIVLVVLAFRYATHIRLKEEFVIVAHLKFLCIGLTQ